MTVAEGGASCASDTSSAPGPEAALRLVSTHAEAEALAKRLMSADRLALDTEGDGMFRYRTRLCTMQLAGAGQLRVVDTLAIPAAPVFCALLGADGPEKIIHDAAFDARVLFAHGVRLGRVFDTAVAARFLGLASTGLSSLLQKFFEIRLPKHQQQADWGLRPIDDEAMRYLEDDVRYLAQLADRLLDDVRARGIEAEVREECAYVLTEACKPVPNDPPWMRVKTLALRLPKERARLVELAEVREHLAEKLDFPPARLINTEVLLAIAHKAPETVEAMAKLLGSKREHAPLFLEALRRAEAFEDAPIEQLRRLLPSVPTPAELTRRKRRKSLLLDFRDKQAKERGVDVQAVLPGHCVNDLVELPSLTREALRAVSGFGECRVERYGTALEALGARWSD